MISEDTINAIKDRTSIVKLIGERVKLERAGRSYKGLCPFHKEKSPSFHVNEERNFYHCFGCQAHGDSIRFLQETEGLSFVEAIRELAGRLGMEVEENRSDQERRQEQEQKRRREELFSVTEAAARYFEQCLRKHPLKELAWQELERRALIPTSDEDAIATTLAAFRVGYAPYGWDGLAKHLTGQGFSPVAGEKVGLIAPRRSGGGHYDRFRHRLMFGVVDLRGRVIAFSGRSLPDPTDEQLRAANVESMGQSGDEPAKYINSPESPIYKKREAVFGLYQGRNAARQQDRLVLVEGNFDVVSLHARGIENVAAPLGTAFTAEQAAQVRRFTQHVVILFDADGAGKRAAVAAREPCQQEGLVARVASLPAGLDPDDLVRKQGPEALKACLQSAMGMLEYQIESALDSGFSAADPQTQGAKIQEVLELIKAETDPTVRSLAQTHADRIASRLGIADARTMQALSRAVRQVGKPEPRSDAPRSSSAPHTPRRAGSSLGPLQRDVLGALTEYPVLLDDPDVMPYLVHASGALALGISVLAQCKPDASASTTVSAIPGATAHVGVDRSPFGVNDGAQADTEPPGETRRTSDDVGQHLQSFPDELRPLVAKHVAAPEFDDQNVAKRVLLDNLARIAALERKQLKAHLEDELRSARSVGDHDREVELLHELMQLGRARLGQAG